MDKVIKNLGKPEGLNENHSKGNSVSISSKYQNSLSAGEIEENSNKNEKEKNKIIENEMNFDELHKIDLNNSQEFKEKLDKLRENS